MTPERHHRFGLQELERIRTALKELQERSGNRRLRPAGHEPSVQRLFARVQTRVLAGLPALFYDPPPAPVLIQPVEGDGGLTGQRFWYAPPGMNGRKPATLCFNAEAASTLHHQVETIFLREALPGRHLLLEAGRRMEHRPEFLHFGYQEAYLEGWALYAESLGEELGLFQDLEMQRGRLELDLQRTARLVLETGLHWRRWSSEQALEFIQTMFADQAAAEIERCIACPGQGGIPKLAERAFLRLRDEVQTSLADRFDLRWFHHELLRHGPIPLDLLRGRVLGAAEAQRSTNDSNHSSSRATRAM